MFRKRDTRVSGVEYGLWIMSIRDAILRVLVVV